MNEKLLIQADKCIDKELHPNCRLLISLYSSKLLPPPSNFVFYPCKLPSLEFSELFIQTVSLPLRFCSSLFIETTSLPFRFRSSLFIQNGPLTPRYLFIQISFCSSKKQLPGPLLSLARSLGRSLGSDRRSSGECMHASPLSECTAVYKHHRHHHQQATQERRKKGRVGRERNFSLFYSLIFHQPPRPPLPFLSPFFPPFLGVQFLLRICSRIFLYCW